MTALLRNPIYPGMVVYGRRNLPPFSPSGIERHDAVGEAIAHVEDAVPAIVSREVFEKVHVLLIKRQTSRLKNTNRAGWEYLLTPSPPASAAGPWGDMGTDTAT